MDGSLDWLADGSMNPIPPQYRDWEKNDYEHPAQDLAAHTTGERKVPRRDEAAGSRRPEAFRRLRRLTRVS
ncbi:MAG: hypothetical protein IPJ97_12010 [Proteobacteria bacterium]|nr:hypothetical protein [Pseudomonadota bacterium]